MGFEDALAYTQRKRKLVIFQFIQVNLDLTYTEALKEYARSLKPKNPNRNQTKNYTLSYKT